MHTNAYIYKPIHIYWAIDVRLGGSLLTKHTLTPLQNLVNTYWPF